MFFPNSDCKVTKKNESGDEFCFFCYVIVCIVAFIQINKKTLTLSFR